MEGVLEMMSEMKKIAITVLIISVPLLILFVAFCVIALNSFLEIRSDSENLLRQPSEQLREVVLDLTPIA